MDDGIKVAYIVGAGTMGHGFAQYLAMNGLDVLLMDQSEDLLKKAEGWIVDNMEFMVEIGEIERPVIADTMSRIRTTTDIADAKEADFVLEAVSENLELKKQVFKDMDANTKPDAILATNTSSYDINEFSAVVTRPERVIGAHWFFPPQIPPCVEVTPRTRRINRPSIGPWRFSNASARPRRSARAPRDS